MPGCSVPHCRNRSNIGYKLYGLPRGKSNKERRQQWERNIGRKDLPGSAAVCEVHFTNDQFENNRQDGRRLLRWNAVPTLFPDENGIFSIISTTGLSSGEQELNGMLARMYDTGFQNVATATEVIPAKQVSTVPNRHRNISILRKNPLLNKQGMRESSVNRVFPIPAMQLQKRNGPVSILRKNRLHGTTEVEKHGEKDISSAQDGMGMDETIILLEEPARYSAKEENNAEYLQTQLRECLSENERLKRELKALRESVSAFGEDQMYYLKNNTTSDVQWSDETILKALRLYMACGKAGYDEIRKQNLPYPPVRTLQSRIRNIKIVPDPLDDAFAMLKVKMKGKKEESMG